MRYFCIRFRVSHRNVSEVVVREQRMSSDQSSTDYGAVGQRQRATLVPSRLPPCETASQGQLCPFQSHTVVQFLPTYAQRDVNPLPKLSGTYRRRKSPQFSRSSASRSCAAFRLAKPSHEETTCKPEDLYGSVMVLLTLSCDPSGYVAVTIMW